MADDAKVEHIDNMGYLVHGLHAPEDAVAAAEAYRRDMKPVDYEHDGPLDVTRLSIYHAAFRKRPSDDPSYSWWLDFASEFESPFGQFFGTMVAP